MICLERTLLGKLFHIARHIRLDIAYKEELAIITYNAFSLNFEKKMEIDNYLTDLVSMTVSKNLTHF